MLHSFLRPFEDRRLVSWRPPHHISSSLSTSRIRSGVAVLANESGPDNLPGGLSGSSSRSFFRKILTVKPPGYSIPAVILITQCSRFPNPSQFSVPRDVRLGEQRHYVHFVFPLREEVWRHVAIRNLPRDQQQRGWLELTSSLNLVAERLAPPGFAWGIVYRPGGSRHQDSTFQGTANKAPTPVEQPLKSSRPPTSLLPGCKR